MFTNSVYLIYMYKEDFALNNLLGLMCHKQQIMRWLQIVIIKEKFIQ